MDTEIGGKLDSSECGTIVKEPPKQNPGLDISGGKLDSPGCGMIVKDPPKQNPDEGRAKADECSIHDENEQLLETVVRYSSLATRKQPETLLLFGLSGAGKTSIVNTIYKELTGITASALQPGSGSTQSKTLDFKWYVNCGVHKDNIIDPDLQSRIGPIVDKLPNIIDCSGKSNVNNERAKEILRLMLTGRIPPGTNIAAFEELQTKKGVDRLNEILPSSNPEWTVTKILFVQSAMEPIPDQLLDMLHDILAEHDDRLQTKFKASLFTVITKYDLVNEAGRDKYESDRDATITAEDFQDKKDTLATALRIKNNVGDNCIPWASYCDTVRMPSPMVRNSVLKLLQQMQCPKLVEHTGEPLPRIMPERNRNALCWAFVLFLVVAFILLIVLGHQSPIPKFKRKV